MTETTPRDLIVRAKINISDADRCAFMRIAPSAPTLLRSLRAVTTALEAALDENGRLGLIVKVNHGLWRSAEAELLEAQAAGRLVVQQCDAERERADASEAENERLWGIISELNERLDKPIRPYADRRIPMGTEREFLREAYGDSLVDDLEAILAKAVQS